MLRWGSASRWIEVVNKHTACKMTSNERGSEGKKKETRRGNRGNGKVGGDARDSHAPPILISLAFLSLAVVKAEYGTLICCHLSAQTRLELGMIMMRTMITMVTVTVS